MFFTLSYHFPKGSSGFVTQLKEMETLTNDIRQACRKIRRRVPTARSGKIVMCPLDLVPGLINKQQALVTNYRALYSKIYQKSQGLAGEDHACTCTCIVVNQTLYNSIKSCSVHVQC